jgi:superfamily II RNA helicase
MEKIASNLDLDILEFDSKLPYTIDKECESILRQKFSNYKEFLLLPEFESLMKLLRRGVAIHHASMIPIFRELVEILFEKGYIKLLFATETFSVGLNMPIKTTIFTDIFKYDGTNHRILQPQEFTQASGRAGRRGMDVKGNVIHLFNLYPNYGDIDFFKMLGGEPPNMSSKFKLSWDLVLKNDFLFYEKLLYSKELQKLISETEEDYQQKILRLKTRSQNNTTTPLEIQEQYKSLNRKKSKKKHFQMSQLREEYPMLIKDLEFQENIQIEQIALYNFKQHLDEIKNAFHSSISKMQRELEVQGFLDKKQITLLGECALYLKEVPSLVFLKMISTLENFNVYETIVFLSCFTNIRVKEDKIIYKKNLNIGVVMEQSFQDMENLCESFSRFEGNNNLFTGENYGYHYNLVNPIQQWIECKDESSCVSVLNQLKLDYGVSSGDFTKAILKISNTASQLEQIAEKYQKLDWLQNLKQIPKMILKFVATNQSLYV